jgi:hypothetical protein
VGLTYAVIALLPPAVAYAVDNLDKTFDLFLGLNYDVFASGYFIIFYSRS